MESSTFHKKYLGFLYTWYFSRRTRGTWSL